MNAPNYSSPETVEHIKKFSFYHTSQDTEKIIEQMKRQNEKIHNEKQAWDEKNKQCHDRQLLPFYRDSININQLQEEFRQLASPFYSMRSVRVPPPAPILAQSMNNARPSYGFPQSASLPQLNHLNEWQSVQPSTGHSIANSMYCIEQYGRSYPGSAMLLPQNSMNFALPDSQFRYLSRTSSVGLPYLPMSSHQPMGTLSRLKYPVQHACNSSTNSRNSLHSSSYRDQKNTKRFIKED